MVLNSITYVQAWLNSLIKDEDGQGMVEYGLLVGLISLVAIAAVTAIGIAVSGAFQTAADTLP